MRQLQRRACHRRRRIQSYWLDRGWNSNRTSRCHSSDYGCAGFGDCIVAKIYKWEFDPAPEVTYTHTYNGRIGEAW